MQTRQPWELPAILVALMVALVARGTRAGDLSGTVRRQDGSVIPAARVTLFLPDLSFFREARTDAGGGYAFAAVPAGTYRLACSALNLEYQEVGIGVGSGGASNDFSLGPESHVGRWSIVGNTAPEFFDATDIGILRRDGKIFYCHDTVDPILFDPVTGQKSFSAGSSSEQGCMSGSLLADGRILMVGGQEGADPGSFRNAVPWVKTYAAETDSWQWLPPLQLSIGRWYPGLARLADGSFLAMGGGTRPNAARTATCERFDLSSQTWNYTGSMLNPCEFPPSALLFTGEVLATWSPPQLYNPASGEWRATGNFVQSLRGWPDHSDHSLVVLSDSRALAVGIRRGVDPGHNNFMGETYDPLSGTWTPTSNPGLLRFQTEVVQLPDGRVLAAGGESAISPPPAPNALGIVKWTDLYDPALNTWRRMADMSWFREYHAVTLLVPDGRVLTTGGTRIKFQYGPTSADIEAFEPPYLFRGVRPAVSALSSTVPVRGQELSFQVSPLLGVTNVVLMGTGSHTHWTDGVIPRRLVLPVLQDGSLVRVTLPSDPTVIPLGYYMLFAMVDDIPSVARIIRVDAASAPVVGDLDFDRDVDGADVAIFADCLSGPETPIPPGCDIADLDHDFDVDLSDFGILQGCLGGPSAPSGCVGPEG
ncbi:MAG: DUF1929 domain-containing protein [Planctomycetes bacterium]|nr:DUF1929 domain-containing protein [Planctomycetota bacterium]